MLHATTPPGQTRAAFRAGLASGKLLRFPGAFNPLSAMLIARHGFEGVYISGAVISADLGLPDIGLTTLSEVAGRAQQIARVTSLPALVDADTGFGEPMNAARTVQVLEDAGAAGLHIEDQVNPKRCGHLDGKDVVDRDVAVRRIKAAVAARRDPSFVIAARTDAAALHGIDDAIDRAKAYAEAGADLIFPEAMTGEADFERFRAAIDVPILANMTEFGKSKLLDARTLENLGVNVVIYPVTLLRLAMHAADTGLTEIAAAAPRKGCSTRCSTAVSFMTCSTTRPTTPSTPVSTTSRSRRAPQCLLRKLRSARGWPASTPTPPRSRWSTPSRTPSPTGATRSRNWPAAAASRRWPTCSGTANCPLRPSSTPRTAWSGPSASSTPSSPPPSSACRRPHIRWTPCAPPSACSAPATRPRTTTPPPRSRPRPCGCSPSCPRWSPWTSGAGAGSGRSGRGMTWASPPTSCT